MCHRCDKNACDGSLQNSPYALDADTCKVLRMVWVSLLLFHARPREILGRDVQSSCARTLATDASPLASYRPLSFYFRVFCLAVLCPTQIVLSFSALFFLFRKTSGIGQFPVLSMFSSY